MSPHPRQPEKPSAVACSIDSRSIVNIRSTLNRPSAR